MKSRIFIGAAALVGLALSLITPAAPAYSDWTAVYARVDKVVMEPNDSRPERIQVWGGFAIASKANNNDYEPAERGYLYFSLAPGKEDVCRKEWADMKSIAGTEQIIGFGGRNLPRPRIRPAKEKPAQPDVYPVSFGLQKVSNSNRDYAPFRSLMSLPKGQR
jgi:hypothetical protein